MGKQALIVDDDEMSRDLLSTQLEAVGFQSSCAVDGEKGLAVIRGGRQFDIVFIDLVLPKLNGLALLKAVRDMHELVHYVPIFMMTGSGDKNVVAKAVGLGVTDFLIKPWSASDLSQKLVSAMAPLLVFAEIKSVISRLHVEEKDMFNSPGLSQFMPREYRAFAVTLTKDRYCFVVKKGIRVSEISGMSQSEASKWLTVFIRRKNKWQFCWPDASVSLIVTEGVPDLAG